MPASQAHKDQDIPEVLRSIENSTWAYIVFNTVHDAQLALNTIPLGFDFEGAKVVLGGVWVSWTRMRSVGNFA